MITRPIASPIARAVHRSITAVPILLEFRGPSFALGFIDAAYSSGAIRRRPKSTELTDLVTVTRASGAGVTNAQGKFEWLPANVPRLDHDPVTLEPKGLLLEGQATNLLTYSEDFAAPAWVSTASSKSISGAGALQVVKVVESTASSPHYFGRSEASGLVADVPATWSFEAKLDGRSWIRWVWYGSPAIASAFFNLSAGVVGSLGSRTTATIKDVGGGWYKCTATVAPTLAGLRFNINLSIDGVATSYQGDGVSGVLLRKFQIEQSPTATTYIPTPAIFTSRSTTGTYTDSTGVMRTAAIDEPRYDHGLVDGKWVSKGLMLEGAATNFLTHNKNFVDGNWNKVNSAVLKNTEVAIDGTLTASRIYTPVGTTANASYMDNLTGVPLSPNNYVASAFIKKGTDTVFNMDCITVGDYTSGSQILATYANGKFAITNIMGVITSAGVEVLNDGWFRVWAAYVVSYTLTSHRLRVHTFYPHRVGAGESAYTVIGGTQIEVGSYPSSYIPTEGSQVSRAADLSTSSQVTRAADVATINTLSPWYNPDAGNFQVRAQGITGKPLLTAGNTVINATSDLVADYSVSYDTDQAATSVTLGEGHIESIKYFPRAVV